MTPSDEQAERYISGKLDLLPRWFADAINRLRKSNRAWLRFLVGMVLIVGGLFWFLPVLGLWMLPLGLIFLAEGIPPLRRRLVGMAIGAEQWWNRRRRRGG